MSKQIVVIIQVFKSIPDLILTYIFILSLQSNVIGRRMFDEQMWLDCGGGLVVSVLATQDDLSLNIVDTNIFC